MMGRTAKQKLSLRTGFISDWFSLARDILVVLRTILLAAPSQTLVSLTLSLVSACAQSSRVNIMNAGRTCHFLSTRTPTPSLLGGRGRGALTGERVLGNFRGKILTP